MSEDTLKSDMCVPYAAAKMNFTLTEPVLIIVPSLWCTRTGM